MFIICSSREWNARGENLHTHTLSLSMGLWSCGGGRCALHIISSTNVTILSHFKVHKCDQWSMVSVPVGQYNFPDEINRVKINNCNLLWMAYVELKFSSWSSASLALWVCLPFEIHHRTTHRWQINEMQKFENDMTSSSSKLTHTLRFEYELLLLTATTKCQ